MPRRTMVAITMCVACAAWLPATAGAKPSMKKSVWGPAYVQGVSQFPRYRDLGARLYQEQLRWADVARARPARPRDPHDPAYVWPPGLTRAVAEARRYRMRVAVMILSAPSWANGGKPWNWVPRRPADFADFAYAASRRYPSVKFWMVWGEPSREHNFEPLRPALPGRRLSRTQAWAPRHYARMLDAAYATLKRADPADSVIGGMTYTTGDISTWQWISNMRLPNGRAPRLDMYGHNPFSWRPPNLRQPPSCCGQADFSDLARLGKFLDRKLAPRRHGKRRRVPLFLSEFMLPTAVDKELNFHVDRRTQALWIRRILKIVRRSARIRAFGWVHLYDRPPRADGQPVINSGLLDHRGIPKPGYYAFKAG